MKLFSKIFICFLILLSHINSIANNTNKDIKLLILIIASDEYPIYVELQKIWRAYMHLDPEHVEAYFIKADPNLQSDCIIDQDIVWLRCQESIKPGIINKTIMSLEYFLPRIGPEFDYVLRTNLSSFYIFPRLLDRLTTTPKFNFYYSVDGGTPNTGSGAGYILSPDLAQLTVQNKYFFINNASTYDDVLMGQLLTTQKVKVHYHPRADFGSLKKWHENKNNISPDTFQCRVKGPTWDIRLQEDVQIHKELLFRYYGITI